MRGRFYRTIGSLLGLLAILMATLAPTVSQALAASHRDDMATAAMIASMGPHCPMSSMESEPPQHVVSHESADNAPSHSGKSMSDGQACGYCNLLAHMPVVTGVPVTFAVTARAIQHPVATRFESVRLVEPLTSAQPRAPPVLS
ncbi:DUF2946 domain-containing protein [Paraburkholderia sp.]|uniref:DUF2946 domain-containing protein n=1 Tax=Paraburkholderia sp. TaxID=1926495 RepID=UPI00238EAE32|nr:DUF2946 domain-containing protein [Paraburkholderia sp.]MDE1179915.1 DUF2946 domain-containing protein [Paraburkholderia sp.]